MSDLLNYDEEDREREAAKPADEGYVEAPCVNCGRIRVYLRRDGQHQCEKCDVIQEQWASSSRQEEGNNGN